MTLDVTLIKRAYFLGIGGIGMSAIARYFLLKNIHIGGYDKTQTSITSSLEEAGAEINYEDDINQIPEVFLTNKTDSVIIYTPAIPKDNNQLKYFQDNGYLILKRSEALGVITKSSKALCVAGTHGKTTTSSMLAHILYQSPIKCTAFLGGIMKNYDSNLLLSNKSKYTVVEADEFDRSFHHLSPFMSIITSCDADHLDIYGTSKKYKESFEKYTSLIQAGGVLLMKNGLNITPKLNTGVESYSYGKDQGDFHAENIVTNNGRLFFDYCAPNFKIKNIELGVPLSINIENAISAITIAHLNGVSENVIRTSMSSYTGVNRRFDFKIRTPKLTFLTDYAHHPQEIKESLASIKELYKGKKITVIFQPHLYSRTKDFYKDFAKYLSLVDEVLLLDIYPAREKPIPGVTSRLILDEINKEVTKQICSKTGVLKILENSHPEVLISLGAGDIENLTPEICRILKK